MKNGMKKQSFVSIVVPVVVSLITSLAILAITTKTPVLELERDTPLNRSTSAKLAELEVELSSTKMKTSELEKSTRELSRDLRLTREEYSALQAKADDLEKTLRNTKARTVVLDVELDSVKSDLASLNATKASKVSMGEISDKEAELKKERHRVMTEVQELSVNLTLLAETSSRVDKKLQQELRELSESALNHTHYNQIQQDIASKASQTDLELPANSTTTFLQRVEGMENTIMQVQWNTSQLTFNLTRLEGRVQQISITPETKAGQQNFNTLSGRVTSLEGSTVDKDTFQKLKSTVQNIQETKADETDLSQLKKRVNNLYTNTATNIALNGLDMKLKSHILSSDETHSDLTFGINSNSDSIRRNRGDISLLQMQSSSAAGLAVPWMTIITSSVTLVTACWTTYTY